MKIYINFIGWNGKQLQWENVFTSMRLRFVNNIFIYHIIITLFRLNWHFCSFSCADAIIDSLLLVLLLNWMKYKCIDMIHRHSMYVLGVDEVCFIFSSYWNWESDLLTTLIRFTFPTILKFREYPWNGVKFISLLNRWIHMTC